MYGRWTVRCETSSGLFPEAHTARRSITSQGGPWCFRLPQRLVQAKSLGRGTPQQQPRPKMGRVEHPCLSPWNPERRSGGVGSGARGFRRLFSSGRACSQMMTVKPNPEPGLEDSQEVSSVGSTVLQTTLAVFADTIRASWIVVGYKNGVRSLLWRSIHQHV